jgi:hypothetical protein
VISDSHEQARAALDLANELFVGGGAALLQAAADGIACAATVDESELGLADLVAAWGDGR